MKKAIKVAAIAAMAFVLTGCMRMHVELTLHEDNTADGSIIMAFSDELAESLGMTPEEMMETMGGDVDTPDGATVEPYKQDGFTGTKSTFASAPIEGATGGPEMKIERVGDEFVVSGEMDMAEQGMGGSTGDPTTDAMMEGLDMAFKVTFPGPVSSHNGKLEGNTVTWQMVPGEVLVFDARGSALSDGSVAPAPKPSEEPSTEPTGEDTEPATEPTGEDTKPATDPTTEETPVAGATDTDKDGSNLGLILGIAGGVLVLAIIGIAIAVANNKKKAAALAAAPGGYDQGGFQQQGYDQQGFQQGYQQPGPGYAPPAQTGYQQPGQQGYQQPGGYQQPPAPGGYQPPAQQDFQQPPAPGGYQAPQGYQPPPAPEQPTQQFPQPPVDPQDPQNPQQ